MAEAFKGIDHVMIVVPQIDEAGHVYRRLGFDVQPRGVHSHMGTANHLMILDGDYIELLGILKPDPLNDAYRKIADEGGALANIALQTDGAELAHAAWTKAGFAPEPIIEFSRGVEVGGKMEKAEFRIVRLPHDKRPGVGLFVCDQRTPQFVYRKEWQNHPNGSLHLTGVTVVADDPSVHRAAAAKVFGAAAIADSKDGFTVQLGRAPIRYIPRRVFAEHFDGLQPARAGDHAAVLGIKVRDIDIALRALAQGGAKFVTTIDGRLLVPAQQAGGVTLEFSA
jgi:catechol 2,3-dioxygenase-like lactoylglutathione lyase family enzyme